MRVPYVNRSAFLLILLTYTAKHMSLVPLSSEILVRCSHKVEVSHECPSDARCVPSARRLNLIDLGGQRAG